MLVRVDASAVHELTKEAIKRLERAPDTMARVLKKTANKARRSHKYQNRSGDLEASTRASDAQVVGDRFSVTFGASEEYASYLEARGFQELESLNNEAEEKIGQLYEIDALYLSTL